MTYLRKHLKLVTVAAACVAIGAAGSAIATAGAASSATTTATSSTTAKAARARGAGVRALERRTVHANVVVATKSGFATVTVDRGFVQSVNGRQLTIREGTKTTTYKTITLTIPSNADGARQPPSIDTVGAHRRSAGRGRARTAAHVGGRAHPPDPLNAGPRCPGPSAAVRPAAAGAAFPRGNGGCVASDQPSSDNLYKNC